MIIQICVFIICLGISCMTGFILGYDYKSKEK